MLFATESQKEARKWPKGVPYSINALLTALIPPPTNTVIDMRFNMKHVHYRFKIFHSLGLGVLFFQKKLAQLKTEKNQYIQ